MAVTVAAALAATAALDGRHLCFRGNIVPVWGGDDDALCRL
jgi:hypothetical protein